MRISVNWLKEFVDPQLTPEAIGDALTMAGFEVEDIEERRTWADGVVVGKVMERQPHPDADKLSVCTVDIGEAEPSTIVCGAANVRADIYVAVATVKTYLPQVDLKIKSRKVRGVASAGMICSLSELGLAKDSEGIHIFEQPDLQVGQDVRPLLGLDDTVLDLSSTANRADALSMVGIAREVAAITGAKLTLPIEDLTVPTAAKRPIEIALPHPKACPIYIGTVLEDVKIGPSPTWLKQRLEASGTRPINNVVDITNYVLLEWGQPLHAFDLDRLSQGKSTTVSVRFGKPGETIKTLDDKERQLQEQTLAITANDLPVALAGVMGGAESEVHDQTQNVFLEAAFFDAAVIRRSARSQGLRTEASARYERGVNPAELDLAASRAIQLMVELADAKITHQQDVRTEVGQITPTRSVGLRLARVQQILGSYIAEDGQVTELSAADVEDTLTRLGCSLTDEAAGRWTVSVPAYRYRDLEREIDLIEEVARLFGYNRFGNTLPQQTSRGRLSPEAALARQLRAAFRGAGLTEVLHYSLTNPAPERVVLENPLFTEYSALRSDLLSGLIDGFQFNLEQGNGPLNAFEIGHVFANEDGQLNEYERVGGILGGNAAHGQWTGTTTAMTWYEAKGILETVFQQVGLAVDYRPDSEDARLHPGRTASLWVRGRTRLGTFGQLHPRLRQERDLPEAVYVFELNWDAIATCLVSDRFRAPKFKSYSSYPGSDRDIAFYAPTDVSVADLEKLIARTGGQLLETVTLFDQYTGKGVPDGQRSLAFRMCYRASDRTLTDQDIDPLQDKIRAALEKKFKVSLRS
ncbi:phenylalanine--tRNA ligase subunit beta [Leptolyngbya cf. ectocarpi LEGE 11479]|uniref:Phenylalanine--tRNA ligase beta subunit n=1 Tax=Leptolyngbya cf. ectocarpi LEGE 11479 TaxID=1828722 RepID=A0A928ZVP9_LEPEC|nr:phenylalanine--tRNA ligase subunit beta [Leptolyngbya ectocarpi]MBE9068338.1 phenylalanine--tRNA ligase subunit beta [Leptolyngbya cf. ectocarpi LEGE 11479]